MPERSPTTWRWRGWQASGWPLPAELDDVGLERLLFPRRRERGGASPARPRRLHQELRRKEVTLQLLWHEYYEIHPEVPLQPVLRVVSALGGEAEPDDAAGPQGWREALRGLRREQASLKNRRSGELTPVELFVGALGASSYTYAEATLSQELPCWVGSHERMLDYFGGSPEIWVPDNLRSGVTGHVATSLRSTAPTPTWRDTTARWSSHHHGQGCPASLRLVQREHPCSATRKAHPACRERGGRYDAATGMPQGPPPKLASTPSSCTAASFRCFEKKKELKLIPIIVEEFFADGDIDKSVQGGRTQDLWGVEVRRTSGSTPCATWASSTRCNQPARPLNVWTVTDPRAGWSGRPWAIPVIPSTPFLPDQNPDTWTIQLVSTFDST